MIYTITLNPAIDYYLEMDKLNIGELNSLNEAYTLAGGKGINVSKVLKNFSITSTALGFVGGFTGNFIKNDLKNLNIDEEFIELTENTRINIKLKTLDNETEISGKSPTITEENLNKMYKRLENIKENDILVLSGSVPKSIVKTVYADIIEKIDKNVKVILDTRGEAFDFALKKGVFLTKPNKTELEEYFGKKLNSVDDIINAGKELQKLGSKNVLISLGGEGSILLAENEVYIGNAPKGKLISSVGAGDSMVAGIIYGLITENSLAKSYKYGIASGSSTAFSEGLTTFDGMKSLIEKIEIIKK